MPSEWSCSYHEVDKWELTLVDQITDEDPCIVAISALTASVKEAYGFSNALRKRGIPTVIGGLHATACPDEAANYADAVVVGDGEPVWSQVLEDASLGQASG
ncbi:MAG: cobalamin-dependent protein, partial [Candidatus Acidiferrum sp.]